MTLNNLNGASPEHKTASLIVMHSTEGKRLTKHFSVDGCRKYDHPRWFKPYPKMVHGFSDLSNLLTKLETQPNQMVVIGSLASHCTPAKRMRRLAKDKQGAKATLIDTGSRVLHLDIDERYVPSGYAWDDPRGLALKIWSDICVKVPAFEDVSVHWQASSSAAMPGTAHLAKFHFWLLLDEPIVTHQRKDILALSDADKSLASICQPNYTAAPTFEGVANPLEGLPRSGAFEGASEFITVSQIKLPSVTRKKVGAGKETRLGEEPTPPRLSSITVSRATSSALSKACAAITDAKQRNNEINRQSYYIGGLVAGGQINRDDAYEALLLAARETGHDRHEEAVANGFGAGLLKPIGQKNSQATQPFYPRPDAPRDHAIHMHGETIRNWAAQAIAMMRPIAEARRLASCHGNRPAFKVPDGQLAPRVMLTGAQGVGKTAALVGREGHTGVLHYTRGMVSIVFLPTHSKAAEAALDYDRNGTDSSPQSYVVRGRSSKDPKGCEGQKMCLAHDLANAVVTSGMSVRQTLCTQCSLRDQCGYMKQDMKLRQLTSSEQGAVLFAAHDYAFLPLPGDIKPDLAIFDERPRDFGVQEFTVSTFDLRQITRGERCSSEKPERLPADNRTDNHEIAQNVVQPVLDKLANAAINSPDELLKGLRDDNVTPRLLTEVASNLHRVSGGDAASKIQRILAAGKPPSEMKAAISGLYSNGLGSVPRIRTLLRMLAAEMNSDRKSATGVTTQLASEGSGPDNGRTFHVCCLKPLRCGTDTPFLHLDGTGDILVGRSLFGADLAHHHYPVERNAKVTQVTGRSFSKQSICGIRNNGHTAGSGDDKKAIEFRSALMSIIDRSPTAAVFGSKDVIHTLGLQDHARACHFGALRGLNRFETFDKALIIGREQPTSDAIDRIARAFASANGQGYVPGEYINESRVVRAKEAKGSIQVKRHPDAWGDRILRQIREAEIEQAIDRVRLIHNKYSKEVYLLSPVVIDITVDYMVKWLDFRKGGARLERAVQSQGFIPLSPRECGRLLPQFWSNQETARADLGGALLKKGMRIVEVANKWPGAPHITHISYRREVSPGDRSRRYEGIVFAPPGAVREKVEAITGSLREFDILDHIENVDTSNGSLGELRI